MADKTATISAEVVAVVNEKSITDSTNRLKDLQRQLKGMKVDWGNIAKYATAATSEIQTVSDAAGVFAQKLSSSTIDSVKHLKSLSNQLEDAHDKAKELSDAWLSATDESSKNELKEKIADLAKHMGGLTTQIHQYKTAQGKQIQQLTQLVKVQEKYQKAVSSAANYDTSDMMDGIKDKISGGNIKGIFGELGSGIKKSILGGMARGGQFKAQEASTKVLASGGTHAEAQAASAAQIGKSAVALSRAAMLMGGAVAGFAAFIALVKKASDHMTGLNKALIDGLGFANDFVSSAEGYRGVMDSMRKAATGAHWSMLKFGKNSEDVLKIVNSYAKESTGSLIKTNNMLSNLGSGVEIDPDKKLEEGMRRFTTNAIIYGKALNMEGEEVASMMGKFQSEVGYGANQIQGLMENVVKSAATANMPMNKFMDIFKSVIPNVELYQNRLEELTGTIKLLSKTMSPRDVKQFMDAFSKGFGGTDFKSRLKTVLITGSGKVNKTLLSDFESRAKTMASKFEQYGISPSDFMEAFKGGESSMAKFMAKAQAKSGGEISGTDIGEAMKLTSYESARQKGEKGDVLSMATALRGAGLYGTYEILKQQSQTFTKGFDGLSEHVIQQTGISEQQYLALRQTSQSMKIWQEQIKRTGITSSESMNKGIQKRLGVLKMTWDDWGKLSSQQQERILFEASQEHDEAMNTQVTAEDLAQEQVTATTSIGDKIENVIGFLLEKLYGVMQPLLDIIDNIWRWLTGTEDQKNMIKEVKNWSDASVKSYEDNAARLAKEASEAKDPKVKEELMKKSAEQAAKAEETKMFQEKVNKNIDAGKTGGDLVRSAIDIKTLEDNAKEAVSIIKSSGVSMSKEQEMAVTRVENLGLKGAGEDDRKVIYELLGEKNAVANIMTLGRKQIEGKDASSEAKEKSKYKKATRRPGAEFEEGPKTKKEREAKELAKKASDFSIEYGRREAGLSDTYQNEGVEPGNFMASSPNRTMTTTSSDNFMASSPVRTTSEVSKSPDFKSTSEVSKSGDFKSTSEVSKSGDFKSTSEVSKSGEGDKLRSASKNVEKEIVNNVRGKFAGNEAAADHALSSIGIDASKTSSKTDARVEKPLDNDVLIAIRDFSDSINTQVMGISMNFDDMQRFFKNTGIHLNKSKFGTEISNGVLSPMLNSALENQLTMFLYALIMGLDDSNKKTIMEHGSDFISKGVSIKNLAAYKSFDDIRKSIENKQKIESAVLGGIPVKDYGGPINTTGYYRLQAGEHVSRRGEGGKSVVINANINVNGAQDPKMVAAVVRNELYNMSEKH